MSTLRGHAGRQGEPGSEGQGALLAGGSLRLGSANNRRSQSRVWSMHHSKQGQRRVVGPLLLPKPIDSTHALGTGTRDGDWEHQSTVQQWEGRNMSEMSRLEPPASLSSPAVPWVWTPLLPPTTPSNPGCIHQRAHRPALRRPWWSACKSWSSPQGAAPERCLFLLLCLTPRTHACAHRCKYTHMHTHTHVPLTHVHA